MAQKAKSYGRVYYKLYHLVPLYKRPKKDVGKNQVFQAGDFTLAVIKKSLLTRVKERAEHRAYTF